MKALLIYCKTTLANPDGTLVTNPLVMPNVDEEWARGVIATLAEDPPQFLPIRLSDGIMLLATDDIIRLYHVELPTAKEGPNPNVTPPPLAPKAKAKRPRRK